MKKHTRTKMAEYHIIKSALFNAKSLKFENGLSSIDIDVAANGIKFECTSLEVVKPNEA